MYRAFLLATSMACLASGGASAQSTTTYSYDEQGQVKSVAYPSNTVTYGYDRAGNRININNGIFGGNAAPSCPVTGIDVTNNTTFRFRPPAANCSDANGHQLVFTAASKYNEPIVSPAITLGLNSDGSLTLNNLPVGQTFSFNVNFTVSDGNGGTTNGMIYVGADYGSCSGFDC